MSRLVRILLVATALTAVAVGVGVFALNGDNDSDDAPPEVVSTPLEDFDIASVVVARRDFCSDITVESVSEALEADDYAESSYTNGDRAELTEETRDISHEFGCAYATDGADAADGTSPRTGDNSSADPASPAASTTIARAWVFAPPVTDQQARVLVDEARDRQECEPVGQVPDFGEPGVARLCAGDDSQTVNFAGLFGDAWFSCSLQVDPSVSRDEAVDRAGRWCVAAITATDAD